MFRFSVKRFYEKFFFDKFLSSYGRDTCGNAYQSLYIVFVTAALFCPKNGMCWKVLVDPPLPLLNVMKIISRFASRADCQSVAELGGAFLHQLILNAPKTKVFDVTRNFCYFRCGVSC
jgi:hypothetical protein